MTVTTQAEYAAIFTTAVQQQNPETNPNVSATDWNVYAVAQGAVASGLAQDINSQRLGIFTQYESGLQLDYKAYSLGIQPRQATTYATVIAYAGVDSTIYFFPAGTIFTSVFNGYTYQLVNDTTTSDSENTTFYLRSVNGGNNYAVPADGESIASTFTNTINPSVTITSISSADGDTSEGDGQFRKRILFAQQNPKGGGRDSDYVDWAIASSASIQTDGTTTYAIQNAIIPSGVFTNSSIIGVFTLSGSFNYNNIVVNQKNIQYSLTTDYPYIQTAGNYITLQKPAGAIITMGTVDTYTISNEIVINVVLAPTITLDTMVANIDGSQISVHDFILQQFRYGIISYDLGGTQLDGSSYILLSYLEQVLDVGLSYPSGIYQQLLIDRQILVDGLQQNIEVPYAAAAYDSSTLMLSYVYDLPVPSDQDVYEYPNVTINAVPVIT